MSKLENSIAEYVGAFGDLLSSEDKNLICEHILDWENKKRQEWKEKFKDWYVTFSGQNYVPSQMIEKWIEENLLTQVPKPDEQVEQPPVPQNESYWQKRCEAAEKVIIGHDVYATSGEWQEWEKLVNEWSGNEAHPIQQVNLGNWKERLEVEVLEKIGDYGLTGGECVAIERWIEQNIVIPFTQKNSNPAPVPVRQEENSLEWLDWEDVDNGLGAAVAIFNECEITAPPEHPDPAAVNGCMAIVRSAKSIFQKLKQKYQLNSNPEEEGK